MKIEQIYTGCLAQGAYYIQSEGEAAVIDPLREADAYIEKAKRDHAVIKYVFETHFHADFVSGHLDLAKKTGAKIIYGPTAAPAFDAIVAKDGEEFQIGKIRLQVIHTPGHTMESSCFLLKNEKGEAIALFTGDTLFIGDVGRPDLAQKVRPELTQDILAAHLYDSLHHKILPLPDDLIVYPAHGAGSACGKNMSNETTDTLGHQKAINYALNPSLTKEEFVKEITTGLTPPPKYFPLNVMMNIKGYESIDEILKRGTHALTPEEFEAAANETDALMLDTRDPKVFVKGFIPNSINIGLDGQFASWVGTLVPDIKQPILIVTEPGREEEAVMRLARVGYDNAIGYLAGGLSAWRESGKDVDKIDSISADELAELQKANPATGILDVRRKSEYDSQHITIAENIPLDYINENMQVVDRRKQIYVHCASGYRSVVFTSILRARGFQNLVNVEGGIRAIKDSGKFQLTRFVEPTTML
jgi:glyoxylase-like metal-dependent hydrolase (beta-lactamase superfamily II)/rhodanese-related sulfurtransferase